MTVRNLCPPNSYGSFVEGMPRKLVPIALITYAAPTETTAQVLMQNTMLMEV